MTRLLDRYESKHTQHLLTQKLQGTSAPVPRLCLRFSCIIRPDMAPCTLCCRLVLLFNGLCVTHNMQRLHLSGA